MPLNHADLSLMMQGIEAPGNAAMQVREEQDRRKSQAIQEDIRQKMLQEAVKQTTAEQGRTDILKQQASSKADESALTDMIKVNPFLTDEGRAGANNYLKTHPKWGAVGIQLAPPQQKPVPQPGQSSAVMELKTAKDFRDKAAALGPEGDLDLQKWYIHAADVLEKRATQTKADPTAFDKVSETTEIDPVTQKPTTKTTRTRNVPAGQEPQPTATPTGPPQPGEIRKGYRFRGGDPAKPASWEKVQ